MTLFLFHFREEPPKIEVLERPDGLGIVEMPGAEALLGEGLLTLQNDVKMWYNGSKRGDLLLVAICALPEFEANKALKRKAFCKTVGCGATWLELSEDFGTKSWWSSPFRDTLFVTLYDSMIY